MERDKAQFPTLREKGIYKFHIVSISGDQNIQICEKHMTHRRAILPALTKADQKQKPPTAPQHIHKLGQSPSSRAPRALSSWDPPCEP